MLEADKTLCAIQPGAIPGERTSEELMIRLIRRTANLAVCVIVGIVAILGQESGHGLSAPLPRQSCDGPRRGPMPLAVMFEKSFTVEHFEAAVPRFVLYANGDVLRLQRNASGEWVFSRSTLSEAAFSELWQQLSPSNDFLKLKARYDLRPGVSDLPEIEILLFDGEQLRSVSVYGHHFPGEIIGALAMTDSDRLPDNSPPVFEGYLRVIHAFSDVHATGWKPVTFEVTLHPWSPGPGETGSPESTPWPANWPGLEDAWTRKIDDDGYAVFVPAEKALELDSLMKLHARGRPISMAGKEWEADYLPVVPGSCEWEKGK